MKLWKEFRDFAFKGNVIDLAVGVMIGAAFSSIVTSAVNDLFTPLISLITGKVDFSTLGVVMGSGDAAPVLAYGSFIQAVINFLLVAVCIFLFVKLVAKFRKPAPAAPAKPARLCTYCFGEVNDKATRCPHCTSELKK